jgi:hypothetical protein
VRPSSPWSPTRFVEFVEGYDTSAAPAQIVTDAGPAFIKALGNRGGPHLLASEWIATHLAKWFGLSTFDCALLVLQPGDVIPFIRGGQAHPGPAFVTRKEIGQTWDGCADTLAQLDNPQDITRLVLFDTWVLNWDRHPPDRTRRPNYGNVFLSMEGASPGRFLLKAMDHTHCFGCRAGELSRHVADIDVIQDERIYGLFPAFRPLLQEPVARDVCRHLATLRRAEVERLVHSMPAEWDVTGEVRDRLVEQIVRRANFVAEHIMEWLARTP